MVTEYNKRGFEAFVNETIVKVDTSCINVVHFHTASGKVISVDAEERNYDIPIVSVHDWDTKTKG